MFYELTVIGAAIADRFLLKRNAINIGCVSRMADEKLVRFAINFSTKRSINSGVMTFSLRNKKNPTTVVARRRVLDWSKAGNNSQFITFDLAELEKEAGEPVSDQRWILHVKFERSHSWLNPLYKIFPLTTNYSEEFSIE